MSDTDKTYTLAEAARIRALDECQNHGHSFNIITTWDGAVHKIACDTCGWTGVVTMGDRPKRPEGRTV